MGYRALLRITVCAVVLALSGVGCGPEPSPTPTPSATPTVAADLALTPSSDGPPPRRARAGRGRPRSATAGAGLPVTPNPAECTVAGTTYEDVLARIDTLTGTPRAGLVATPQPAEETPQAQRGTPEARTRPADAATAAAITATMREAVACLNTPNPLAFLALVTDQLLLETIALGGMPADPAATTPVALPPEQYVSLLAVGNVRVLPDGRVGALVELLRSQQSPEIQVTLVLFLEQAGRWRIDRIISNLPDEIAPISGAPVAAVASPPVP